MYLQKVEQKITGSGSGSISQMYESADPDSKQNFKNPLNTVVQVRYKTVTLAGSGSGSISKMYGSADPDPHQNFMDPRNTAVQEWYKTVTLAGSLGGRAGGERMTGLGAATGLVFAAGGLTKTTFNDVGTRHSETKRMFEGSFFPT
jgi:hypothetical protein